MGFVNDTFVTVEGDFALGEAGVGADVIQKFAGGVSLGVEQGIVRGEFAGVGGLCVVLGDRGREMVEML